LIHGLGDGSYVWNDFLPTITSHYDTVAVDLRGHGDSDWDPETRYDVRTHVVDVIHVVRALGLDHLVLIGHSMGGDIAIRVATECCKRIEGLVVVDFCPNPSPESAQRIRADFDASHQAYPSIEDYAAWLAATRPLVSKDILLRLAKCALRAQADMGFRLKADPAITRSRRDESDCEARESVLWTLFPRVPCPVLVVRGAGSAVLHRDVAERMINSFPDARLQSVPSAGHGVVLDNPEGFASAVRPFLSELLTRGATA
jgi:pimeloyl-ACP methyl ester carboxylesterase